MTVRMCTVEVVMEVVAAAVSLARWRPLPGLDAGVGAAVRTS